MAAGHPELVAIGIGDYVGFAVDLAGDLPRMQRLRDGLRQDMTASPYLDHRSFVAELEKCYFMMVRCQPT